MQPRITGEALPQPVFSPSASASCISVTCLSSATSVLRLHFVPGSRVHRIIQRMQGPTTVARHALNLHSGASARHTSCVVVNRRSAMIPDARTVSTISPSAGRRARSPVSRRLVKNQAVGTVIPQQTKPAKEASSRCGVEIKPAYIPHTRADLLR